eukprot:3937537-Rhodomonas_salina.1
MIFYAGSDLDTTVVKPELQSVGRIITTIVLTMAGLKTDLKAEAGRLEGSEPSIKCKKPPS